jgi:hypothetical protein
LNPESTHSRGSSKSLIGRPLFFFSVVLMGGFRRLGGLLGLDLVGLVALANDVGTFEVRFPFLDLPLTAAGAMDNGETVNGRTVIRGFEVQSGSVDALAVGSPRVRQDQGRFGGDPKKRRRNMLGRKWSSFYVRERGEMHTPKRTGPLVFNRKLA